MLEITKRYFNLARDKDIGKVILTSGNNDNAKRLFGAIETRYFEKWNIERMHIEKVEPDEYRQQIDKEFEGRKTVKDIKYVIELKPEKAE
jgi:hypothetical protein